MFRSSLRRAALALVPALLALALPAPMATAQTGVCCTAGVCSSSTINLCAGTFISGGSCTPNPCAVAGVCCRGATCNNGVLAVNCSTPTGAAAGARFMAATACNTNSNTTPCCYADYNKSGAVTVQDIFDFLSDWFDGRPYAKVGSNGSGAEALNVQDIFEFLNIWFAGGC